METKICTKCGKEKELIKFNFRNDSNKYRNECISCFSLQNRMYRINNPWKQTFLNIKKRCNNPRNKRYKDYGGRGIKCLITSEELKELWFRDKAYLLKKPSIDREDNDGHYCLDNCRFIEFTENSIKDKRKQILQYDLNNNFIKEWNSATEAASVLHYQQSEINRCLNKKRNMKSYKGFIWRYI